MRKLKALLAAGLAALMAGPVRAEELTAHERDLVQEWLAPNMVLPNMALWQFGPFKPYVGSARLVCGTVNFQSAMRRYVGSHRFYAILDDGRVTLAQIQDDQQDTSGRLHKKLDFLCGKA